MLREKVLRGLVAVIVVALAGATYYTFRQSGDGRWLGWLLMYVAAIVMPLITSVKLSRTFSGRQQSLVYAPLFSGIATLVTALTLLR